MKRCDGGRLAADLAALARIGATPEGGVTRLAFSPQDAEARALVAQWMREAGLAVRTDAAGNLIGRCEGREERRAIAVGSHIDTVPNGGRYDGALGVLAGIECARTLAAAPGTLRHAFEVIAFANEEGARRSAWLFGSRALAGLLEVDELGRPDEEGVTAGDRLAAFSGGGAEVALARRSPSDFRAYLELHVEQGPTLEALNCPIGVVEGITGRVSMEATVQGAAAHAGTTPMEMRHDALVTAAEVVLAVRRLAAGERLTRVGTVGQLAIEPNALNIVPGRARLALEFRDGSDEALAAVAERLRQTAEEIAGRTGTTVEVRHLSTTHPVPTSEAMRAIIERAARACGLRTHRMPSGAGHDAMAMGHLTDMGMIFVPSVGGISHSPYELTGPEACADGCDVLLNAILEVDRQPAAGKEN
jgi:N-carbamoyl-L-amino-acid hydrolase